MIHILNKIIHNKGLAYNLSLLQEFMYHVSSLLHAPVLLLCFKRLM